MAEAGLFISWGVVVRGRETKALDVFADDMAFWAQLEQDGRIEGFETAILEPHGGDLTGFVVLRGTRDQLDEVRRSDEFRRHQARATMLVEHLRVVEATLRDGLEQVMGSYREGIEAAT